MADQATPAGNTQPPEKSQPSQTSTKATVEAEDSDPDFDDLDDVLDQFSANAPKQTQPAPAPTASEPAKREESTKTVEPQIPSGPKPDETEEQFIARLSSEMSTMLSSLGNDPAASTQSPEDIAKMGADLEAFTKKMEAEGIQPEDLLKAILGEEEGGKLAESARQEAKTDSKAAPSTTTGTGTGSTTFEDTIRRTMSRLDQSNTEATNAAAQSSTKSEEDMLAEMLKAMDAGGEGFGGGGGEDGLSKMFLDMMQQLTHKEMLYEPMRELHTQYPSWLSDHKPPKLPQAEHDRYSRQSAIVADIVRKFEEPGFSDDDPVCREYIWDRMQAMQGEGAPPEELVKNPFPGSDFGGIPGLGGGGGGGEGMEALEEGCPTQ